MKKITLILLALCMVFSSFGVFASEWDNIYVNINEVNITVDGVYVYARNFVHEGTTYLSLRDMGTVLGYEVGWDGETSTASLTSGAVNEYNFTPGEKSTETIPVLVNDVNVVVDGNAVDARNFLYNDTTYLALRDIGNATGFDVYWDEPSFTAVLTSPGKDRVIPSEQAKIDVDDLRATVNGIEIPHIFLVMSASEIPASYTEEQVYEYLNSTALGYAYYVDEAKRLDITISAEEKQLIDSQYDALMQNQGGEEKFGAELEKIGYTTQQYEKEVKEYWEAELVSQKVKDYLMETESGFKELKNIAKPGYEEELEYLKRPTVIAKHILIPFDNDGDVNAEKAKAEAILKLLQNGEEFDTLLSQNNNDPGQTSNGYEVYVGSGFVEEFEEAALKLKKGEISGIVETSYGYHIIKAIDDYVYEVPFDEYFESAHRVEINQMYNQLFEAWAKNAETDYSWIK